METQDPTSVCGKYHNWTHVISVHFGHFTLHYTWENIPIYPQTETWESNMDGNSDPTTMNIGDWPAISDLFDRECE